MLEDLIATDYAVIKGDANDESRDGILPAGWNALVPVGPFVMIGRISAADSKEFVEACLSQSSTAPPTISVAPVFYTLVRRDAPKVDPSMYVWDPDGAISIVIQLSRLVRSNSHCTDAAVRTIEGWDHGKRETRPLDPQARFYASRIITPERAYLDDVEAEELNRLVTTWYEVRDELPSRVRYAMWLAEFSHHTSYLQIMCIDVVAALEALLNTGPDLPTKQFVTRVRKLADAVDVAGMSRKVASDIYELRSGLIHGDPMWTITSGGDEEALMLKAQNVLRAAVRKAIEDREFAAIFADEATINAMWPIAPPQT